MDNQVEFSSQVICAEQPRMLLYESKEFCKLLFRRPERNIFGTGYKNLILNSTKDLKCEKERLPNKITLVGYYIQPISINQGNIADNQNNNSLAFLPVWAEENIDKYSEYVQEFSHKIFVHHNAINVNFPPGWNYPSNTIDALGYLVSGSRPLFDHSELQFSYLGVGDNEFNKAFISRHELFLLVQNSEYIGIVGARVSSGNILATLDQNGISIKSSCNTNYFTYRFIGFDTVQSTSLNLPENTIGLKVNSYNKNLQTYDPAIPSETWATPCPPMWSPQ